MGFLIPHQTGSSAETEPELILHQFFLWHQKPELQLFAGRDRAKHGSCQENGLGSWRPPTNQYVVSVMFKNLKVLFS